jgi:hypothetical protein
MKSKAEIYTEEYNKWRAVKAPEKPEFKSIAWVDESGMLVIHAHDMPPDTAIAMAHWILETFITQSNNNDTVN